jgi:uncharacterized membrane protein
MIEEPEKIKVKPWWFKVFIALGPILLTIFLSEEVTDAFEESQSSMFSYIVIQVIIISAGLSLTLINAIYLDKEKEKISYEQVVKDNITPVFWLTIIVIGIGFLQWVANI